MTRDILAIDRPDRAAALLQHPIRRRILLEAATPVSAAELAVRLGEPRQRLGYHVRQLERHGFLELESRRRKRNMEELRYVATARAYVLAPQLLGELAASPAQAADTLSAGHLLGLAVQVQRELTEVMNAASAAGVRVLTLSLTGEVRFATASERAEFARELTSAITDVVGRYSSPAVADGAPGPGRPFRLVVGCYPVPPEREVGT